MTYPPQGPPPGYGPAPAGYGYGYGYGPPLQEHPQGTTVMILGILGIVLCQICSPIAWVMGNRALAEIDAAPHLYSNRGNVQIGRICGMVGTALLALFVVVFGVYIIVVIGAVAADSSS